MRINTREHASSILTDDRFTPTEARFLAAMALRHTDSCTGKVHLSGQEGIRRIGASKRSIATDAIEKAHRWGYVTDIKDHFVIVSGMKQSQKDWWFAVNPPVRTDEGADDQTGPVTPEVAQGGRSVWDIARSDTEVPEVARSSPETMDATGATRPAAVIPEVSQSAVSPHVAPSTSHIATTSTSQSHLTRPSELASSLAGDEEAEDTATPAGPLPKEPLSPAPSAPAEEVEATKPCGCHSHSSCPDCRGDVPVPSKYSEAKLKEFHDRRLGEEGLNEYGEPLGLDY